MQQYHADMARQKQEYEAINGAGSYDQHMNQPRDFGMGEGSIQPGMSQQNPGGQTTWNPQQQPGQMAAQVQPQPQPGQTQQQPGQMPQTGLMGAENALQGGLMGGLQALGGGIDQGAAWVNQNTAAGVGGFQPYMQQGQNANNQQSALSGAMGPQAQQQAYDNFISSPGQAWLQEKGERAVTRNAAAMGGLGGGRVQQELQRQGQGLAAQDFQNSFDRLGTLSNRGMQGAQGAGNLYGQAGNTLGQMGLQGGMQAGNMFQNTGTNIANARNQAGRDIAAGVGGMSSSLADLINQQGQGISDLTGQAGSNLAGIVAGSGEQQAAGQMTLAEMLAKQRQDAAAVNAGLPGLPGTTQTKGWLGGIGDAAAGIGTGAKAVGIGFSDIRLKTNIQAVGATPGGSTVYAWDWNTDGRRLTGATSGVGVIAQEVPEAALMGPEGYLMVDYGKVV